MRKWMITIILGISCGMASLVCAQDDVSLIEQYKQAVRQNNKEIKEQLFLRILESPKDIEILQKQNPRYYAVFELQKLISRIEALKVEAKRIARNRPDTDFGGTTFTSSSTGSSASSITTNRDRTPNSAIARSSPNQSRTPNRVTSRTSNQSRTSIQESLRNRSR